MSNRPPWSRHPKYEVPIWSVRSAPCLWCGDRPPSPVLCRHPAAAAPRLMASIAAPDSDPKLIADTLTTDDGRNAPRRSRCPPRTFAAGTMSPAPMGCAVAGEMSENVRCLIIG